MLRKFLLSCGVVSSAVYIAADLAAALLYADYHSFTVQAISELTAIGAPTKALVEPIFIAYDLLVIAFAAGLWMSAREDRVRVTAAFVGCIGLVGLLGAPFANMNVRGSEFAANDMWHIAVTTVIVLCIFGGVMFSAAAFGRGFFNYSMATLAMLAVFGVLAGLQGPRLLGGEPTPWLGMVERIHVGAYLLWMAMLSLTVWRRQPASRG